MFAQPRSGPCFRASAASRPDPGLTGRASRRKALGPNRWGSLMPSDLTLSLGQHSERGRKETNQDFHGALIPERPALLLKGAVIAIADGIGSSAVSHVASETAVKSFLTDYYDTPDTWSVRTSARRVIAA